MTRTLNQRMADAHEADIAEDISGTLHKASGSQWHAQMDVGNGEKIVPFPLAADGKATLGKSISLTRDMWLKAVAQTFNKIPTIWLRFYKDDSLREVSTDLVVIERRDFTEMLQAARNWRTVAEEIGYDGLLEAPEVLRLLKRSRDQVLEEAHPLRMVSLPAPGHCGGCDCCR